MWRLDLPSSRMVMSHIDTALTLKNGTQKYPVTAGQKKAIRIVYDAYDTNSGLHGINLDASHLDPKLLDALKNGYNEIQIKGRLKKLREKLLLSAKRCPCCGIADANTLDHHLPIDKYKVLSLYVRNLVAYCTTCNNKKRSVTGVDPNKRFIHPYFCALPENTQFLFAKVTLRGRSLKFKLYIKPILGLSAQLITQMEFMMNKVDLKDRLEKELNIYFSSIATHIKSDYELVGKTGVIKSLVANADHQAKQFSLNHWRHAVLQALSQHDKFCDGGFYEPWALGHPPQP